MPAGSLRGRGGSVVARRRGQAAEGARERDREWDSVAARYAARLCGLLPDADAWGRVYDRMTNDELRELAEGSDNPGAAQVLRLLDLHADRAWEPGVAPEPDVTS